MADVKTITVNGVTYNIKDDYARQHIATLEAWKNSLLDSLFPVGFAILSYDATFNPNGVYPGSWSMVSSGYALVGYKQNDSKFGNPGGTYGYANPVLPQHSHTQASHSHVVNSHHHGPGTLAGYYKSRDTDDSKKNAFGCIRFSYSAFNVNSSASSVIINRGTTGDSAPGTNAKQPTISTEGVSSITDRNYQPSMAVCVWKRTA